MLRLAAIALIGAVSAAASAEAVISLSRDHPSPPLRQAEAQIAVPASDAAPAIGEAASVVKSEDGHYWAEASVNGEEVRFLVDTGASAVALTPEDALRLGFDPKTLNYSYTVNTANGQTSGLKQSLLGMTYLGRLSQFEATQSALILRP
jgi:aspartyl protease family protein